MRIVANTAEDGVPEALESLYQVDVDWNLLLKKLCRLVAATLDQWARGKPLDVWFQDEARIGQKNHLVYA